MLILWGKMFKFYHPTCCKNTVLLGYKIQTYFYSPTLMICHKHVGMMEIVIDKIQLESIRRVNLHITLFIGQMILLNHGVFVV